METTKMLLDGNVGSSLKMKISCLFLQVQMHNWSGSSTDDGWCQMWKLLHNS